MSQKRISAYTLLMEIVEARSPNISPIPALKGGPNREETLSSNARFKPWSPLAASADSPRPVAKA